MPNFIFKNRFSLIIFLCLTLSAAVASAQTRSISYQGKLNDGGAPANGVYDFVFRLYNVNGVQFSFDVPVNDVQVTNGIFNVLIPFEETPGIFLIDSRKFLEIAVRPGASTGAYTTLAPRQEFGSVPSAVSALFSGSSGTAENALALEGFAANQFVKTNDARLSDARNPLAGSANYIQNSTVQQATSNFNISGSGTLGGTLTANIVRASQMNSLANERIFVVSGANVFAGRLAGTNASGDFNTFVGSTSGFFTSGARNTFVGSNTGFQNMTGSDNSFFGAQAGEQNQSAIFNSFFGSKAGLNNNTGFFNSFFGGSAGQLTTTGSRNVFLGINAGFANTTGSDNTIVGTNANLGANNLTNANALGSRAFVTQNNSLVLGSINGVNDATADTNVGIGTTAPTARLNVVGNTRFADSSAVSQTPRGIFEIITTGANANFYMQGAGGANGINFGVVSAASGGATLFIAQFDGTTYQDRIVVNNNGTVSFTTLGAAGATALCRNASNELSTCSSSVRYKQNINKFNSGLELIKKLRPVAFDWKANSLRDLGLVAEEVAAAEPLLATYNANGEVEGVKYDRVGVVLVNAVQEQQAQIERQEKLIREQQEQLERARSEIEALKLLVCAQNSAAAICKPRD